MELESRPITTLASRIGRSFVDLIYPPSCAVCGIATRREGDFCAACVQTLPGRSGPACPRCARRLGPHLDGRSACSRCPPALRRLEGVLAAASYEGSVRDLIHRLKFRGERSLAFPLGRLIGATVRAASVRPSIVVPVPLHWRRRMARGYNQAELLADVVARDLGVSCRRRAIRRTRPTLPQSRLGGVGPRARNVRDAFAPRSRGLSGATILIVDDVLSTGATLSQCALALRQGGAGTVTGAVVAR
ncbi:MAG: ComF family protein [Planctomycetota bacterium]|nr:ComF family protein [Planctomycetota bacterium]